MKPALPGHWTRSATAMWLVAAAVAGPVAFATACDRRSGGALADASSPDGGVSMCNAPAAARAVVTGLFLDDGTTSIGVMRLADGQLTDSNLRLPVANPRRIAFRSDGAEALIAYGGYGQPYGAALLSISDQGTSAALVDTIAVGTGDTPFDIAYSSDDHAVLAVAAPSFAAGVPGTLIGLDRSGQTFVPGPTLVIPDNWPLETIPRPHHPDEVLMTRADLLHDPATQVFRIDRAADSLSVVGAAGELGPPTASVAVAPTGDRVYGPTTDPDHPLDASHLDVGGILHTLTIGDGVIAESSRLPLPGIASFVASDPASRFLVLDTAIYQLDESGRPDATRSRLTTVSLGDDGTPLAVVGQTEPFTMGIYNSFAMAPSGQLVTAIEMYPDQAPAAELHPIVVWAQPSPGAWQRCQTVYAEGQILLSVAP